MAAAPKQSLIAIWSACNSQAVQTWRIPKISGPCCGAATPSGNVCFGQKRTSVWVRRGVRDCECHRLPALRAPGEYVVVSVDQLDKHLVLTGRQISHADCIVVRCRFHPTPSASIGKST